MFFKLLYKLFLFIKYRINFKNEVIINKSNYKNLKIKINGTNNSIKILNNLNQNPNIVISINGQNNNIVLKDFALDSKGFLYITINGENNDVSIDDNISLGGDLRIQFGTINDNIEYVKNVICKIGKNLRVQNASIYTINSNNSTIIGDDCLFASNVSLFNTDGHPIYSKDTNQIINKVKNITISNNCWLGYAVVILKNVFLPQGTIVGWGSIVTKSFEKEHTIIAGNPAKIVKANVKWERFSTKEYIDNKQ